VLPGPDWVYRPLSTCSVGGSATCSIGAPGQRPPGYHRDPVVAVPQALETCNLTPSTSCTFAVASFRADLS
jgi:hypothetical protein